MLAFNETEFKDCKSLEFYNDFSEERVKSIAKTKEILKQMHQTLSLNQLHYANLNKQYYQLFERQKNIEASLEKLKRVSKNKQKKHYKFINYIPLSKIYFYCPKRNPFYYMLLDIIIACRKKNKQKYLTNAKNNEDLNEVYKSNQNRYHFSKSEDNLLISLLKYENEEYIDWESISTQLKRIPLEVFFRSLELSNFYEYKKWTLQEDTILKKSIIYYGPKNWQQISYCLDGKYNKI